MQMNNMGSSILKEEDEGEVFRFVDVDLSPQIDMVLVYDQKKQVSDGEKERQQFWEKLREKKLILQEVRSETGSDRVFVLVTTPFDVLCTMAERMNIRMPIDVKADLDEDDLPNCCEALEDKYLKTDNEDDFMSASFSKSWLPIFKDHRDKNNFFRPGLRHLLTYQILTIADITDEETQKTAQNEGRKPKTRALEYLIMKGFISDAIVPHAPSMQGPYLRDLREQHQKAVKEGRENEATAGDLFRFRVDSDPRATLEREWIKKWRYQPLWKIRNYFGEKFAFYFAWSGHLITHLWLPLIIGVVCFSYGLHQSIWGTFKPKNATTVNTTNMNATALEAAKVAAMMTAVMEKVYHSFDNQITPIFACAICIWGTVFTETWKRLSNRLAFEWDVDTEEALEPDRPSFVGTEEKIDPVTRLRVDYFPFHKQVSRFLVSASILIVMLLVVLIGAAAIILYRVAVTVKVCPSTSSLNCLMVNTIASSVLNAVFIIVLGKVYDFLAVKLTDWENHRTQSAYNSALILKLFSFQFVNSYISLFYIAFFRGEDMQGGTGIFGLGSSFKDTCGVNKNCMNMLSFQVLVLMIMKPMPKLAKDLLLPLVLPLLKKIRCCCCRSEKNPAQVGLADAEEGMEAVPLPGNPRSVVTYMESEADKMPLVDFTISEYMEKVLVYGYLVLFAASFPLAPVIALLTNLIDNRVDAHRLLWIYRRPVPFSVANIGMWQSIVEILNLLGIVSNTLIITFKSAWGRQLTFIDQLKWTLIIEHGLIAVKFIINVLIPDVPQDVRVNMRREKYFMDLKKDTYEEDERDVNISATDEDTRSANSNTALRS